MPNFRELSVAIVCLGLLPSSAVAGYFCQPPASPPMIVDACGAKVCKFSVACVAIGRDGGFGMPGEAYCPMTGPSMCAPYSACAVRSAKTAEEVADQFARQCDKFKTGAASPNSNARQMVYGQAQPGLRTASNLRLIKYAPKKLSRAVR